MADRNRRAAAPILVGPLDESSEKGNKVDKSPQPVRSMNMIQASRAYTQGQKINRKMFVFNQDGTIAGLQEVPEASLKQGQGSPKPSRGSMDSKDKKFGKISQLSYGAMSVGGETKLNFSDANYMPEPGQQKGARIFKMLGKPGVSLKNLFTVPAALFLSLLTGANTL